MSDPDLNLGGFSLWVRDRRFPDNSDYWDGNWLVVRAEMRASGAFVEVEGPMLHIPELVRFRDELIELSRSLTGSAELKPMEPELALTLKALTLGHISVDLSITPDYLNQTHKFEFETDQSYLPTLLNSLDRLLGEYPVIGSADAS